jgi:hypothetical protein
MDFFQSKGAERPRIGELFRKRLRQYAAQCSGAAWGELFLSAWTSPCSFLQLANCFSGQSRPINREIPCLSRNRKAQYSENNSSVDCLGRSCCGPEGRGFYSRWGHWFFSTPNSSNRDTATGFTQPVEKMSTGGFLGSRGLPACKADKLTAIYEPTVKTIWDPRNLTNL